MLHYQTVEPATLSLLKKLMQLPELRHFYLVGGTALSLQYGHRISVDLDLFGKEGYDYKTITSALKKEFGNRFQYEDKESNFGIFCFINDIKVDIINYRVDKIDNTLEVDGIRIYSPKDIAAMKIAAILTRAKKKDFWDLAELLNHFTLKEIDEFNNIKFPSSKLLISVPQAISYFDDAEESEDPISLKGQTWESVKKIIQQKVDEYFK